jgi:serine/threonine-protein kinase PknG
VKCPQAGCLGSIVDGYCDVCGLAAAGQPQSSNADVGNIEADNAAGGGPASTRSTVSRATSSRLGLVPMGSARSAAVTRPTARLRTGGGSRLGAGLIDVPAVPLVDPRQALMDPAMVVEEKRFCSACQAEVGRAKGSSAGRTKGFCPKCGAAFDFEPKLSPGTLLGGQYEVVGCLAHGGMGWIYLARDRNVNDRWVVVKGLLNTADPEALQAAIVEKQFLAEVEHPLIVEIYNFVTATDGASYIIMEYVGGRSLNTLLKDRMKSTGGRFSPIPVDQAIAFMVEILPAFSYLHSLGLLYCDFKPANVIQVADGVKLIDLGGVRRVDDDQSPIYGTVGFQAPEVAEAGCTVASDLYTVARTLAVIIFEFRGYQSRFEFALPTSDEVPLLAQYDSLYRWLLKGTATKPADRFQTAEEMRVQLLAVLRETTADEHVGAVTRSTPSTMFSTPSIAQDRLDWSDLPLCQVDPDDPMASWLAGVSADEPEDRLTALAAAPTESSGVLVDRAVSLLRLGKVAEAEALADRILSDNPWEWRGVWIHGLSMLSNGRYADAVKAFNSVYGQLPGELAPKLALARACELAAEPEMAERMYRTCARTDAAYTAPAQFGRARLAATAGQRADALAALEQIPTTSSAYREARRKRAQLLASTPDPQHVLEDLDEAVTELQRAALSPIEAAELRTQIFQSALTFVGASGPRPGVRVHGVEATEVQLRGELERAYRVRARLTDDVEERIRLVDTANSLRSWSMT